jgi:DNA-binding MarR family transcriptional regulator
MTPTEQQIPDYLHQTLGIRPLVVAWDGAGRLSAFLTARYRFLSIELEGRQLLLMVDEAADPESPAIIRKHAEQVRGKWDGPIVYVRDRVTAYNRKRLIEQRVPFIVPGNQMYLPELGLDLREYFRKSPQPKQKFRPATQAVLIFMLLKQVENDVTASGLAPALGYSAMTLSRAFDELELAGLAETVAEGRERVLRLHRSGRETWDLAQPRLIDPVKARHVVGLRPAGLHAGHDAVARFTMLAEPRLPVIAISNSRWLAFIKEHPEAQPCDRDTAACEVEVWKYEPREYARPGIVDPLSLFLSFEQPGDERVERALDALLEHVRW